MKQLLTKAPELFASGAEVRSRSEEELTAPLYEEIGRLKMDIRWLEKSCEPAAFNTPELGGTQRRVFGPAAMQAGRRSALGLLLRPRFGIAKKPSSDAAHQGAWRIF